ncbi:SDR family oxidoreductase [Ahrensia sp. R2A130]|uniref:SDR family oxidoreductase n=1 Tax=Ahrensia sp. R2A130 TaxID=744979 RepID=UPI0001E0A4C9|nr:SDR family oxidoreductase [Ahrensia sp. R2A130]EFL88427.1 NAD-dependent epimerase/dehydratase [Ahrensia sp. R2A130]
MSIGIFGAGFSGKAIGKRLADAGHDVWGTTRKADGFETLRAHGIAPTIFDGMDLTDDLRERLADTTNLVISIAPPREENLTDPDAPVDPVLIALEDETLAILAPKLQWVGYLSTVGVYGNHDGAWIDEDAPLAPTSARSRQRVRAEGEWLTVGAAHDLPVAVMRLSGIYGPGRNGLKTAAEGRSRRLVKKDQVFNRIHNHDIAAAVEAAITENTGGIFNITDDEPAPPQDVVSFAHKLLGTPPPPELDFETADLSPMARSFYGENKRVSNARSKAVLGMAYAYPDYRTALSKMHKQDTWRDAPHG